MKTALVGYSGFVGSNILLQAGVFDGLYNSSNVEEGYGSAPDLLIYAGVPAAKFLANSAPEKDRETILQAEKNIAAFLPKKLVLISTIDVFQTPCDVDEDAAVPTDALHPYGLHRYELEQWARDRFPQCHIIRLPALFGKNIKKNFLFDFLHPIPQMLTEQKILELSQKAPEIFSYYQKQDNGFFQVRKEEKNGTSLLRLMESLSFTALSFTNRDSTFQFYSLERLWKDICVLMENDIFLWHAATQPVSAGEIYRYLTGRSFDQGGTGVPAKYDYKTKYASLFGGQNGYISSKEQVLEEIGKFVEEERRNG